MTNPTYTDEQVLKCAKTYEGYGEPVCPAMLRSLLADRQRMQADSITWWNHVAELQEKVKSLQAEVEALRKDAEILRGGIFIGGPKAEAIVFNLIHMEAVIGALCAVTGDDESDYTATPLDDAARATPNETKEAKS